MINGRVDNGGRALIPISLKASAQSLPTDLEVWIDTGFTGDLVLSQASIFSLELPQSGTVGAELGDGSSIVMNTYTCLIDWFGQEKQIEVVANDGQYPLLGVGLLRDHTLTVDYFSQIVAIA